VEEMTLDIPFSIGDKIILNGEKKVIKGMHLYVNLEGEVTNIRLYFGERDKMVAPLPPSRGVIGNANQSLREL
jgi:hypothetical protein